MKFPLTRFLTVFLLALFTSLAFATEHDDFDSEAELNMSDNVLSGVVTELDAAADRVRIRSFAKAVGLGTWYDVKPGLTVELDNEEMGTIADLEANDDVVTAVFEEHEDRLLIIALAEGKNVDMSHHFDDDRVHSHAHDHDDDDHDHDHD